MHRTLLVAVTVLLAACSSNSRPQPPSPLPAHTAAQPAEPHQPVAAETQIEMVNVNIHLDADLILHIRHLTGQFLPTRKGEPPTFDDNLSYIVAIDSAEVSVSMASMTHAMNTYVFGEPDAPLKNLQLSAEGSQIRQKGILRKGPGIPFEMVGESARRRMGRSAFTPQK
jgi:hypothetical protein